MLSVDCNRIDIVILDQYSDSRTMNLNIRLIVLRIDRLERARATTRRRDTGDARRIRTARSERCG